MDKVARKGIRAAQLGIRKVAGSVPDVLAVKKVSVRRSDLVYHVAIHVQASAAMPLSESHALGGRVKAAIQQSIPEIGFAIVHMEPFVDS